MKYLSKIRIQYLAMAILAAAFAAGCATPPPLKTEASTSGIRAAEEVGAAKVPQASLHLQLAKEELEQANALAKKDERAKAASMLLRAQADAELAVMLSHGDAERLEAEKAVAKAKQLRQENP
jgi:hypothetical protein